MKYFSFIAFLSQILLNQSLPTATACSMCFNAANSDAARGLRWSVLGLLLILGVVVGSIIWFFIGVWRRSKNSSEQTLIRT